MLGPEGSENTLGFLAHPLPPAGTDPGAPAHASGEQCFVLAASLALKMCLLIAVTQMFRRCCFWDAIMHHWGEVR